MKEQILFLCIFIFGLSCNFYKQEDKTNKENKLLKEDQLSSSYTGIQMEKIRENLRFDFTADKSDFYEKTIEINASLFNDNADTVCFLSSSCDGAKYSIRYDKKKFIFTPFSYCSISLPEMVKIAPNSRYDFFAGFRFINKETKIKLGFDFYLINKSVNIEDISLADIHDREEGKQTVIWADEKVIH